VRYLEVVSVYCTSYCNRGHDTVTGNPIEHECFKLPIAALEAERVGDVTKAIDLIEASKPLRVSKGVLARVRCPVCHTSVQPVAKGSSFLNGHGSLGWSCDGVTRRSTS
jgi:hypothetical protein